MHSRIIGFTVMMGIMSSVAFAEPAIQPGDTLESLSKARITTNVNTQTATPTAQTNDANADVKVEDIDPIIGETTAETPKAAVQAKAVAAPVIESAPTLASSEPTVSVDDIDVAHPTE
ncbi:hypothetical protein ACG9WR_13615 [Acinetobacter pittii]|uniref:hypothetical protein n=1 Tax=Acinetobacter calcoaceticus/baumannii complex TaxID=909768 RepID=UPI0004454669|nr:MULTISPECIES: hypothetical protein [Acinetobacter calcoaceticus/baumannii complex]EXR42893.1 hypothetical protein J655_1248 [Acinetobacter sp. 1294243]MDX8185786.1 hypothetical protein [Acinetobacter pittii]OCY51283.1 hypothetical protein BFR81_11345 [Acinetobacter pittii]OCY70894.1 hypothetical protein BFR86_13230 [Acinetobacter pittii]OCY75674.1 hypothetical protein BFR88_14795 [Acinetobacter pittii]